MKFDKTKIIKHHKALTLAEVLFTMLIIGVILALLIRTIARINPDKDKYLFLKSYHAVEEVIAASVNDGTKYDQNFYTKAQLAEITGTKHLNLSHPPIESAKLTFVNDGVQKTACPKKTGEDATKCDQELTQANAICYYLAESINTIGPVNCSTEDNVLNFKSSVGVCFWDWWDGGADGNFEAVIDPSCKGRDTGYVVKVFKDGKVYVPQSSGVYPKLNASGNQKKAFEWVKRPLQMKD